MSKESDESSSDSAILTHMNTQGTLIAYMFDATTKVYCARFLIGGNQTLDIVITADLMNKYTIGKAYTVTIG